MAPTSVGRTCFALLRAPEGHPPWRGAPGEPTLPEMPGRIWVGTSGFGYKEWKPTFYPEGLSDKKFLSFYAGKLDAVEIDSTFYRMPNAPTLEQWIAQTHDGFRFSLKASQKITHRERLSVPSGALAYFVRAAASLGPRLGCVLYQLPPNFKMDLARLDAFLSELPKGQPSAFEFRHPSWWNDATYDMLRGRGAALCIHDSQELTTPPVITGGFTYVRLRRDAYSEEERRAWQGRFSAWAAAGTEVFAFIKHKDNPRAPAIATQFASLRR